MGAWGIGSFENDTALDWAGDLVETDDLRLLESAVKPGTGGGYLEADGASVAIAGAEVIAAAVGRAARDLPKPVTEWLSKHSKLDFRRLVPSALVALGEVLGETSELRELWEENAEDFPAWKQGVEALKARLSAGV